MTTDTCFSLTSPFIMRNPRVRVYTPNVIFTDSENCALLVYYTASNGNS